MHLSLLCFSPLSPFFCDVLLSRTIDTHSLKNIFIEWLNNSNLWIEKKKMIHLNMNIGGILGHWLSERSTSEGIRWLCRPKVKLAPLERWQECEGCQHHLHGEESVCGVAWEGFLWLRWLLFWLQSAQPFANSQVGENGSKRQGCTMSMSCTMCMSIVCIYIYMLIYRCAHHNFLFHCFCGFWHTRFFYPTILHM
jgi:hypothetical protein